MPKKKFNPITGHHSVYQCSYHLILVTKYRHKCLSTEMRDRISLIVKAMLPKKTDLVECKGEEDHMHFLLSIPPHICVSKLVNSIKTVTSRRIRAEYATHLKPFYWKPYLWSRSYCVLTSGGATIDTIIAYIQSQGLSGRP